MKKIYLTALFLLGCFISFSQTTLSPNDILFVTVNADTPDNFDFIILKDIEAGTIINFTDKPYVEADGQISATSGEGFVVYTASSPVVAGTIISFSGTVEGEWSTGGGSFNIAEAGENILVYQGADNYLGIIGWASGSAFPYNNNPNSSDVPPGINAQDLGTADNWQYDAENGLKGTASELSVLLNSSANFNSNSSTAYAQFTSNFTILDEEPSAQPQDFVATAEFDAVHLQWTEALMGNQAPAGYLILASTDAIIDPTDGVSPEPDEDLSDGLAAVFIDYAGPDSYVFQGLDRLTSYNFAIYSYTNSGEDIDYNTTGVPTETETTLEAIYYEDFESYTDLREASNVSVYDASGLGGYSYGDFLEDHFAEITGLDATDEAEALMIVGPLNLKAYSNALLSFMTAADAGLIGSPLTVNVTNDLGDDPFNASWTTLPATYSAGGLVEEFSGLLDLTAFNDQVVWIGFYYKEVNTTAEGLFQIDDIKVSGTYVATASSDMSTAGPENDLTISSGSTTGNLMVNNLTVTSLLQITAGTTVTVLGDLDVTGELFIHDGGSLITFHGVQNTGTVLIARNTTFDSNTGKYSIIGSPVDGATTASLGSVVYAYDESVAYGADGSGRFVAVTSPETMAEADAYFSAFTGDITFTGTPNTGNIYQNLVYDETNDGGALNAGFNLVSNPFPSAISYLDLISQNPSVEGALYLWDDGGSDMENRTNSDYVTVNAMGIASAGYMRATAWDGAIRSGQGFFVKATEAGKLFFNNSMRLNGNNDADGFFRKTEANKNVVRLSLSNDGRYSDILLGLKADATQGYDRLYDALKIKGNSDLQLYSLLDGQAYAIQGFPIDAGEMTVNLGFDLATGGSYTLKLEEGTLEGYRIYLLDTKLDEVTDLSAISSYSFSSEAALASDRFKLLLSPSRILSSNKLASNKLKVYGTQSSLTILFDTKGAQEIGIYNLGGQLIFREQVDFADNRAVISPSLAKNQIYILRVNNEAVKFIINY